MMYILNERTGSLSRIRFAALWLVAAAILFVAPAAFAAGEAENTEAERERIEEIVGEYADATIDDENERDAFNEEVVGELSQRLVDVQGLEIALRAFELDEDADGGEFARSVVEFVDRTDERIRRGEPAHRAAVEARERTRGRVPEHVTAGEQQRERSREVRERATDRTEQVRSRVPGADGDSPARRGR